MSKHGLVALLLVSFLLVGGCSVSGGGSVEDKRAVVNDMAQKTLERFNKEVANGPQKLKDAAGYGVFSNANVNLLIASAGSGYGVVVNNKTNERTYMKMAMGGVGLGLGAKDYRVVMIYPKAETLENFVTKGWEAGAHADAAAKAGDKGAEASKQGAIGDIETYSFTEAGLALQATLAGTKYWKYDELNE